MDVNVSNGTTAAGKCDRCSMERIVAVKDHRPAVVDLLAERREERVQLVQAASLPVHAEAVDGDVTWLKRTEGRCLNTQAY